MSRTLRLPAIASALGAVLSGLAMLVVSLPASAAFRVTVTSSDDFDKLEVLRVAAVTTQCHPSLDCAKIIAVIGTGYGSKLLPLRVIPPSQVRKSLLDEGHVRYTQDLRQEVVEGLELDALFEMSVPFGAKGDGPFGQRGSESKVELTLFDKTGEILFHGVGTGRSLNVISSPETVATKIVTRILGEAYTFTSKERKARKAANRAEKKARKP